MRKYISVVPYDPAWPQIFETEALVLKQTLGENLLDVHHIGSTSVPSLSAKPRVDIIAVVKDPAAAIKPLEGAGLRYRGEWNIPLKYGFTRREGREINLHVYEENHPEIELNLLFRDYLRATPTAREEYAALKETLLNDEASFEKKNSVFTGYNLGKDHFIRNILQKSGFNRIRLLKCAHYAEWEAYRSILHAHGKIEEEPDPFSETHTYFVLYKGMTIVAIAHIEFIHTHEAVVRYIATDKSYQHQGLGSTLLGLLERWIGQQARNLVKVPVSPEILPFFAKRGYTTSTEPQENGLLFVSKNPLSHNTKLHTSCTVKNTGRFF